MGLGFVHVPLLPASSDSLFLLDEFLLFLLPFPLQQAGPRWGHFLRILATLLLFLQLLLVMLLLLLLSLLGLLLLLFLLQTFWKLGQHILSLDFPVLLLLRDLLPESG